MTTDRVETCGGCNAPILWARTGTGKMMPVDPNPHENGNVRIVRGVGGRLLATVVGARGAARLRARNIELHMPHHATCPNAARFRKPPIRSER